MNAPLRKGWTQEEFFAWAAHQEERYEFDGFAPAAMNGGSVRHNTITQNLYGALKQRLRGSGCRPFGPNVGIETVNRAVRYPDVFVTCSPVSDLALLVPGPVVIFEVISPSSGRLDRVVKVREYAAVPSVRRYAVLESTSADATVFSRSDAAQPWTAITLTGEDMLPLPEIGAGIPISELYADVDFGTAGGA